MDGSIDPTIHRHPGGSGDWMRAYYDSRFRSSRPPLAQVLVAAAMWLLTLLLGVALLNHVLHEPPHRAPAAQQAVTPDPS